MKCINVVASYDGRTTSTLFSPLQDIPLHPAPSSALAYRIRIMGCFIELFSVIWEVVWCKNRCIRVSEGRGTPRLRDA